MSFITFPSLFDTGYLDFDPYIEVYPSTPSFISEGISSVGNITGGWPNYSRFGGVGGYIESLCQALGVGRPDEPPKKEEVPAGTDSTNLSERAGGYIREFVDGGRRLPGWDKIKKNVGISPKDSEAERKDKTLRFVVQDIFNKWARDPVQCRAFIERWNAARGREDLMALALFDPAGDGGSLGSLEQQARLGLKTNDDIPNGEKIAQWANSTFGEGAISAMSEELYRIATSRAVPDEPIDTERYMNELVNKGYLRGTKAEEIAGLWRTKREADFAMARLNEQKIDIRSQIDEHERLKGELGAEKNNARKKELERAIVKQGAIVDQLMKRRAELFLQDYVNIAAVLYGVSAEGLGYKSGELPEGVNSITTAIGWIQNHLRRG